MSWCQLVSRLARIYIYIKVFHWSGSLTLSQSHKSHSLRVVAALSPLSLSQWLINSANCLASRRIAHHFSLHTPTLPTSSYLCLSNPTLEVPLWQSDLSHEVTPDLSTANNTSHPRSWVGLSDSPIYMVKVTTIFSLINDLYLLVVLIDRIYWIVNWFCWNLFCL
jgi:hypothetical protein